MNVFSLRNTLQNIFLSSVILQYTPLFMTQTIKCFQCRQSSILNTAKLRSTQKMSSSMLPLLIKPNLILLLTWLPPCSLNIVQNLSRKYCEYSQSLNTVRILCSLVSSLLKLCSLMVKLASPLISPDDK